MKKQNLKKNNILKIENASLLIATKALDDENNRLKMDIGNTLLLPFLQNHLN